MTRAYMKHHKRYTSILFVLLLLGILLAYYTRENKQLEMMVLVGLAMVYVIWGIVHHYLMHDLTAKIVIEYIAMASLALTISLFLLKGFAL